MIGIHSQIWQELHNLGMSFLAGLFMTAVYDGIRIFRRILRHGILWISLEDCLYWFCFAVVEFILLYRQNNGMIRFYIFAGTVVGAVAYHFLVSRPMMRFLSKWILKIKKHLKKIWKSVIMVRVHRGRKQ